ncbi:MAG: hypothetical protein Q8K34_18635, partial [Hydrogenophaga sp.]|nr:hypothetical protein [Hydrogenophaga sp.]
MQITVTPARAGIQVCAPRHALAGAAQRIICPKADRKMSKSMHQHSGIRDNHQRGKVSDFLIDKVGKGSKFSVVSAYFTIYAYESLRQQMDGIDSLRFLFGEPRFI